MSIGMQYASVLRIEPEFETVVILQCLECFALVLSHQTGNHNAWHRSLSPAPMREDAVRAGHPRGVTNASDIVAPSSGDPALAAVEPEPRELPDPDPSKCIRASLPEGQGPDYCATCSAAIEEWVPWRGHLKDALIKQDTCDHEWPEVLGAFVKCINCNLPYGQWAVSNWESVQDE